MGRSRKQKVELGGCAVTEQLTVDGRNFTYQQLEGSFSQPNAGAGSGQGLLPSQSELAPDLQDQPCNRAACRSAE